MSEWKETEIGEILTFKRGHDLPVSNFKDGKHPVYGSSGLLGYHNVKTTNGPGVVIGRSGNSVGRAHYSPVDFWAHNTTLYVQEYKNSIPEYIYYLMVYLKLGKYEGGSAVPTLNRNNIHNITIEIPSLIEEQKEIAKTLSKLDKKITLLRQQNQTLEELAQTLFKRWFVEFEFPNEKGEPYKSSGGKMVESELCEILEGWELLPLSSIADYLNGLACQKYPIENDNEKLPVLKIKELGNGVSNNSDWATSKVDDKYIIKNGDIIFSWSGTLMLKIWDGEDCVLNQHLFKVTSDKFPKWFIYQWTNYHLRHFIAVAQSKATTMGHIKRSHLDEAMCFIPTEELLKKYNASFSSMMLSLINNNKEICTLTQLRDILLPKLMSGELRIKLEYL